MSSPSSSSPAGSILTPSGWVAGRIVMEGRRIARIDGEPIRGGATPGGLLIIPGFVDLHVHGGDGVDFMDGEDGVRRFIRYHAAHGTVAIAPTTSTAPVEVIDAALAAIETVRNSRRANEPTVLGVHLEGPFINPNKLGAQMNVPLEGDAALASRWAEACRLLIATVAPEIPGGVAVVEALTAHGCRVQIGHSLASAEETAAAFGRGMAGFTHLFNAMSGVDHRQPGVAAYALAQGRYAEMICDLNHVDATVLLAAYRAIPRLYAITDATTYAGRPDGEYVSMQRKVIKRGLKITLEDGKTLAGSAITMLDAFRNLVSLGLPVAAASELCAARQAEYLGIGEIGRIVPGALASFVALDETLALRSVWIEGEEIERPQ